MSTVHLRRFSSPETLKAISQAHLLRLLEPYGDYLASRGLAMPGLWESQIDHARLAQLLMAPSADTPAELTEALFFIHEMATPHGMDALMVAADKAGLAVVGDVTPTEIAVQVWLADRRLVERVHAESFLSRPKTFRSFGAALSTCASFLMPTPDELKALETDLDDWFETRKRGRGARVFIFPREDGVWFLVRRGEALKREGTMDDEHPSVVYRPEKFDVLVYNAGSAGARGAAEMRINSRTPAEKDMYRRTFGRHLFGNDDFFSARPKYTLEPIRADGAAALVCSDVPGIESVTLTQMHVTLGGDFNEEVVRKATDVFAAWERCPWTIPDYAVISQATLLIKFIGARRERSVTIRPPYEAQFTRDGDGALVESWLNRRGFCVYAAGDMQQTAETVLASA